MRQVIVRKVPIALALGMSILSARVALAQGHGAAVPPAGDVSGTTRGRGLVNDPPVPQATPIAPSDSGIGATGTSPGYGATAGGGATTGNTMGSGTGVGIGNTSIGQSTAQSPVGAPTAESKTPGGPPDANGINMSGAGTNSAAER